MKYVLKLGDCGEVVEILIEVREFIRDVMVENIYDMGWVKGVENNIYV